jgi:2-keto-3-deoxy-L-rhamnonate aldolase RhmA
MNRRRALAEFRNRLSGGKLLTGVACAIPHPGIVEVACRTGHDFVIIDAEHSSVDDVTQEALIRAAEVHGMVSIVKLKALDEMAIRVALDAGACGVIAPHIKSAADMRRLIDYCCFPSRGKRGLCGAARANTYSAGDLQEMIRLANEDLLIIPIIEDGEAIANLDEILSVDERINIFEVGPLDLALSLGIDFNISDPTPELKAAVERVCSTLRNRGRKILYPSRFPNMPFQAERVAADVRAFGASLVYGIDTHCINVGMRALASLKEAG